MGRFIEWVKNFREDSVRPKVDEIRSVYPWLSTSGYLANGSNGKLDSVLLIPSTKRFILQGYMLYASQEPGTMRLYDGQSGSAGIVTMLPPIVIAQSKTDVVTGLNIPFQSGIYMSTGATALAIRVWGLLVESLQV